MSGWRGGIQPSLVINFWGAGGENWLCYLLGFFFFFFSEVCRFFIRKALGDANNPSEGGRRGEDGDLNLCMLEGSLLIHSVLLLPAEVH